MTSAKSRLGCAPTRCWVWMALYGCAMGAASQSAYGQAAVTDAPESPTAKIWIQRYLGVAFPSSAKHFAVYYRSADKDTALFSFDIATDDLPHLLDGTGVFPRYADLTKGNPDVPGGIARDSGSRHFAQRVAALKNAFSAIKRRSDPAPPLEVQLWTAEVSVGAWRVYVSVTTDKHTDETIVRRSFRMPAMPRSADSCVVMSSFLIGKDATGIWQRWSLDTPGYRHLRQALESAEGAVRYDGSRAEALADRLNARGPEAGVSWWNPSELARSRPGDSVQGFYRGGDDTSTALVLGRVDGLFHCYAYTQDHVLTPDPCDAIWAWLGLSLPAGARNASYESSSNMAGLVAWIRFDLPLRDLVPCLAQASALPSYLEFTADPVVKDRLETSYQTDAPVWWCPQELSEGLYALRQTNTKELAEVCAGVGRLSPQVAGVYVGLFSPW